MERNGYGRLFDKDCRLMLENVSPLPENENFLRNNDRFCIHKGHYYDCCCGETYSGKTLPLILSSESRVFYEKGIINRIVSNFCIQYDCLLRRDNADGE